MFNLGIKLYFCKGKWGSWGVLVPVGGRKWYGKGVGGYKNYVHMYANVKMLPVETITGMGQKIKENSG
jgi:hypothetical protein